jgi:hypothetical protein
MKEKTHDMTLRKRQVDHISHSRRGTALDLEAPPQKRGWLPQLRWAVRDGLKLGPLRPAGSADSPRRSERRRNSAARAPPSTDPYPIKSPAQSWKKLDGASGTRQRSLQARISEASSGA